MTDLELFRGLCRMAPLELIVDNVAYARCCEAQMSLLLLSPRGRVEQIYLDALSLFVHDYETHLPEVVS